ncbi:crossover junction endodeoxyribonuclease RusA [Hydrogenivirga caldilitoris]|uniref:Crossover junction endodeoxyribonuclease RusA n=1 Tax=Hydrogenivirga caldilitoris TaxID=246264 RepID=A0A497XRC3_9AQUI|nr:RusA family crossover junction endodeoxyribonuclease [Hydrogenivirga caldilitoris]RLJ71577.1 crossover junction endodeoxyribonuclease RusA [Hydrogenivirga caldilitoris]
MVVLKLSQVPVPKTNRYIRRKGGKVFKPPRVKNWEVRALWELRQQYVGEPIAFKVSVDIILTLPNHRKRDIDNMLKSLWDVLEKAGVLENDNLIYEIRTVKKVVKGQQGVEIKIRRFEEN